MRPSVLPVFVAIASATVSSLAAAPDFQKDVLPVLNANCGQCHSATAKMSDFSIASLETVLAGGKKHGKAVVGGHPDQSPLIQMLTGAMEPQMPMGKALDPKDIEILSAWVKSLPAETISKKQEWRWPYEKPVRPDVPAVKNASWVRTPVDAFISQKLEEKKIAPAPVASKRALIRRVYFDLVGMPPTIEEVEAFEKDNDPKAYEKLVDRLLADTRYGERWARHWLDLVRYGETSGLEGDGAIGNAWRYRDWVIDAFNSDMPYDKFVIQQLAGADEHSKTRNNYQPNVQGHIPLGFLRVAPWDRSNLVAAEVRANYLAEVTTTTGSVFLGLSVGCARCHDHKYDPIPQKDFYRLQSFFNAVQVENVEVPYKDEEFAAKAKQKIEEYERLIKEGPEKKKLDELQKDLLPRYVEAKKKEAEGKEITVADLRLELRRIDYRVFPVAVKKQHEELLEDANRTQDPEEREALDAFEKELLVKLNQAYKDSSIDPLLRFDVMTVADMQREFRNAKSKIFTEEERNQYRELSEMLQVYQNRLGRWKPVAMTVKNNPGPPNGADIAPVRILKGGDYRMPGEAVQPGFLSALSGNQEDAVIEQDRYRQYPTRGLRMTLAKWIASPENPLTARVMVNRLWQYHFGRGIIGTTSDFGANGERPTHPQIIDWLANEFIEKKWSVKEMHRILMNSAVYQQATENSAANESADPENKLLWKFPRRRLQAEEIRDSVLALSGRLSSERGGPSIFPILPEDLQKFARYFEIGGLMWEPNEKDEDARRRSIYAFQRRSMPLPMMASFDSPIFSESCDRRSSTTTPLQSLSMMNGNLMQEESVYLAKRVEKESGSSDRNQQIAYAFDLILSRKARPEELKQFASFDGGLESICRVLVNSNEFLYVE